MYRKTMRSNISINTIIKSFFIIVISIVIFINYKINKHSNNKLIRSTNELNNQLVNEINQLDVNNNNNNRLLEYCNNDITTSSGFEGPSQVPNNYKLIHLLITIRHGDRSTLNKIPNSDTSTVDNSIEKSLDSSRDRSLDTYLNPEVQTLKYVLSAFDLNYLYNNQTNNMTIDSINQAAIDPSKAFTISDSKLRPGQLTSRGFIQHVKLGRYLNSKYSSYLNDIMSNDRLYVRSTSYDRTIQSVSAFLSGLLPNFVNSSISSKEKVVINSYVNEGDEVMHGVGLRLSSKASDGQGDQIFMGSCQLASLLASKQKQSFVLNDTLKVKLINLFGEEISEKLSTITDIADASLPSICHDYQLPCNQLDRSKCLDQTTLLDVMGEADRFYCDRYSGSYGDKATKLSIYPFMNEILNKLIDAEKTYSKTRKSHLTIYSGHDTVIAPILSSIGLYKDSTCVWPPYASRIIFELYVNVNIYYSGKKLHRNKLYIRLLYNGNDMTRYLPMCLKMRLCPLDRIVEYVNHTIQSFQSFENACKLDFNF